MKTIMMLSVLVSLIVIAVLINEIRLESRLLASRECQLNQYTCFKPAVSFASLR